MRILETIFGEIQDVLQQIDQQHLEAFAKSLFSAKRVFVVGEGRSGFMAKAFAMRLMHLGASVFVVGETITPAVEPGDLLVGISGSGKTEVVVRTIQKSKEIGADTYAVTTDPSSALGTSAAKVLVIPAATKYRREGERETIQPLGSLFDQAVHVTLDGVCLLYGRLRKEDSKTAFGRHSNLE